MPRIATLLVLLSVAVIARSQSVMAGQERKVGTAAELVAAIRDAGPVDIVIMANLTGVPTLH